MLSELIVLTCTVQPMMKTGISRTDVDLRMKDYENSLKKWVNFAKNRNFTLLIVENSGNIDKLKNIINTDNKNILFHQVPTDKVSADQGISAGEFAMLKNSIPIIQKMPEIKFCWKITGRLFIDNFSQLLDEKKNALLVNRFYSPFHILDSRVIGFPKDVYLKIFSENPEFRKTETYSKASLQANVYSSMEEYITILSAKLECKGTQINAMKKIPIYIGTSASTNKRLNSINVNTKLRFLNLIRPIVIRLLGGSAP